MGDAVHWYDLKLFGMFVCVDAFVGLFVRLCMCLCVCPIICCAFVCLAGSHFMRLFVHWVVDLDCMFAGLLFSFLGLLACLSVVCSRVYVFVWLCFGLHVNLHG